MSVWGQHLDDGDLREVFVDRDLTRWTPADSHIVNLRIVDADGNEAWRERAE